MSLPNRFPIVQGIAAKYGVPPTNDDEARRAFTNKVAATLAAKYPSEGWGTKRSSAGSPLSKDVVCTRSPFLGADILLGSVQDICWQETGPLDGQVWVEVPPYDYLAGLPASPSQPPDPTDDLAAMQAEIEALQASQAALEARLTALEQTVAALPPPVSWGTVSVSTNRVWGHAHQVAVQQPEE